jgi:hypothetical protein
MTIIQATKKPTCVCCGKPYGQRWTHDETIEWAAPVKKVTVGPRYNPRELFVSDGPIPTPPPYEGNQIVVKNGDWHIHSEKGCAVMTRALWDGKSWWGGYDPFCTLRCALVFARAASRAGYRIKRSAA